MIRFSVLGKKMLVILEELISVSKIGLCFAVLRTWLLHSSICQSSSSQPTLYRCFRFGMIIALTKGLSVKLGEKLGSPEEKNRLLGIFFRVKKGWI